MYAKYHLNVHNTHMIDGSATVEFGGHRHIRVVVSASKEHKDTLVLEATAEFEPTPDVLRVFQDLARGVLPSDARPFETLTTRVEPGQSLGRHIPYEDVLPQAFRSFSRLVEGESSAAANRTADLHRWRTDLYPAHRRNRSTQGTRFSFDGEEWFVLPSLGSVRMSVVGAVRLDDGRFTASVQPLVDQALEEPIGFTLLAEAAEISESNGRAALVMGMAALEVGLKDFIGSLVPHAEWLALNAPTPPVVKMLTEYLPLLPVRQTLPSGRVDPPPRETLDLIRNAIEQRNGIAHTGRKVEIELVDKALGAVSDVLRLLDFYMGQEWAAEHMSYEFGVRLGLRKRDERRERKSTTDS